MDWQDHMKQVAVNWLTRGDSSISLDAEMLMLFGNPDLFQEDEFTDHFDRISPMGVFNRATYMGKTLTYCGPLFGAPIVSMYVEVAALLGVKKIVACGYVGGVLKDIDVGSYVIPSGAVGLDGCTRSYSSGHHMFASSESLTSILCRTADQFGSQYAVGNIVSIDALMLETDAMIKGFASTGYLGIDLETACLYAVGSRLGLQASSIHIVSDSPAQKEIDSDSCHNASFADQVKIAINSLLRS